MTARSSTSPHRQRSRQFDLLRILFAALVILAHAFEITDGGNARELFSRWTHSNVSFGTVAVDGFFLLSGYLIVQSWQTNPRLGDFLRNRLLRILPGFAVAFLLSTLFVGLVAPGVEHFFHKLGKGFVVSLLLVDSPITPPVFPGLQHDVAAVNGSMWTIPYEIRCYLLVAVCGMLTILRRRSLWLATTVVMAACTFVPPSASFLPRGLLSGPWYAYVPTGDPFKASRLVFAFLIGGCFYLFRDKDLFKPLLAVAALLCLVAVVRWAPAHLEPALAVFGGYLMFAFCARSGEAFNWLPRFPDISYGLYLYGWPVESFVIWYFHRSPWFTFVVATAVCVVLGWLSWHLVERPMLRLKRRSSAVLPPP